MNHLRPRQCRLLADVLVFSLPSPPIYCQGGPHLLTVIVTECPPACGQCSQAPSAVLVAHTLALITACRQDPFQGSSSMKMINLFQKTVSTLPHFNECFKKEAPPKEKRGPSQVAQGVGVWSQHEVAGSIPGQGTHRNQPMMHEWVEQQPDVSLYLALPKNQLIEKIRK